MTVLSGMAIATLEGTRRAPCKERKTPERNAMNSPSQQSAKSPPLHLAVGYEAVILTDAIHVGSHHYV
jgi:hypothetical protein